MLHQFEMSSSFLGTPEHVTLLEADGTLLGIFHTQKDNKSSKSRQQNKDASNVKEGLSSEIHADIDDTNTNLNTENEVGKSDLTSQKSDEFKQTDEYL